MLHSIGAADKVYEGLPPCEAHAHEPCISLGSTAETGPNSGRNASTVTIDLDAIEEACPAFRDTQQHARTVLGAARERRVKFTRDRDGCTCEGYLN